MQMPVMTGVECAHAFRKWESASGNAVRWGRLPLVALTANVLEEHVSLCFESGMDHFLSKPLRDESIKTLRSVAKQRTSLHDVRVREEEEEDAERVQAAGCARQE